jgi:hypothetical protein
MTNFLRRLFGRRCCTEWTQWTKATYKTERAPTSWEKATSCASIISVDTNKTFLERKCTVCGMIQQRRLKPDVESFNYMPRDEDECDDDDEEESFTEGASE